MVKSVVIASLLFGISLAHAEETWNVDKDHAQVLFKATHLGFSHVYGWFKSVSGTVMLDDKNPAKNSVNLEIDADSLDTMVTKRDQHLKGPDFFDVKQFPKVTFKSDSVKKLDDKNYEIKGNLTLHGVAKPVTLTFNRFKTGEDPWKNTRTGGEGKFTIKRSDFNMKYMLEGISDEIEIVASIEAIKKK